MAAAVSVRALARRLGLSPGTVSKALSGAGGIAAATIARVRAEAAVAGWRRDPLLSLQGAVRRRGRAVRLLAVVSGRPRRDLARTRRLVADLSAAAAQLGYRLHLVESDPGLGRRLAALGACGVLVDGPRGDLDIDWTRQPGVQIGGTHSLPIPRVGPDAFAAVLRCIAEVRAAGWRRIACLVCAHDPPIDDDRRRLAAALLAAPGLPPYAGPIGDRDGIRCWLRRQRPEAVIGFNPAHRDLAAPGTPFAALHVDPARTPACSGIRQDPLAAADAALRLLDLQIRHRDAGIPGDAMLILGVPGWHPGTTLARRRPSAAVHPAVVRAVRSNLARAGLEVGIRARNRHR